MFIDIVGSFPNTMRFSNFEQAMIVTSHLMVGQADAARGIFVDLAKRTSETTNQDDLSLNQYACARLEGMAGEIGKVEERLRSTRPRGQRVSTV